MQFFPTGFQFRNFDKIKQVKFLPVKCLNFYSFDWVV